MNNPFQENQGETQPYTPQTSQTFDVQPAAPSRFPWGCLLGGCLGVIILGLVGIGLVTYLGYSFYQQQLTKYTSSAPVELPGENISDEEVEAISARFEEFRNQFKTGDEPQEFIITEQEINALIAGNPDLKGRVFVKIEEGNVTADVSFPTDSIPGGKGRYFNGSVTLHVELQNGVLVANVMEAEANGTPIPQDIMTEFRKQNLAKDMYDNPETAEALRRCESLTIDNDRIILKVRQKASPKSSSPGAPPSDAPTQPSQPEPGDTEASQPPTPPESPANPNP